MTKEEEIEVLVTAIESGFMISTAYGQGEDKLMPMSDRATLINFAKNLSKKGEI